MRVIVAVCICLHIISTGAHQVEVATSMVKDKSRIIGETHGAYAKEILCVVDQNNVPLLNARIYGSFWPGDHGRESILVDGLTNKDGKYVAEGV